MHTLAVSGLWLYVKGNSKQVGLQGLFSLDRLSLIEFTIPLIRADIVVLIQKWCLGFDLQQLIMTLY